MRDICVGIEQKYGVSSEVLNDILSGGSGVPSGAFVARRVSAELAEPPRRRRATAVARPPRAAHLLSRPRLYTTCVQIHSYRFRGLVSRGPLFAENTRTTSKTFRQYFIIGRYRKPQVASLTFVTVITTYV